MVLIAIIRCMLIFQSWSISLRSPLLFPLDKMANDTAVFSRKHLEGVAVSPLQDRPNS